MKLNKKQVLVWITYVILDVVLFFIVNTWGELIVGLVILLVPAIYFHKRFKKRTKEASLKEKVTEALPKNISVPKKFLLITKNNLKELVIALIFAVIAAIIFEIVKPLIADYSLQKNKMAVATVIAFDNNGKPISSGSGFFISSDGVLLTNYHVIDKSDIEKVQAKLQNGAYFLYKQTIWLDPKDDIAVIKFDANNLPFIPLGKSSDARDGEGVFAIGTPLGLFENTVSNGIISNPSVNLNGHEYIQFTAPISSGNSGGPLISEGGLFANGKFIDSGEVLGMTSRTISIPPSLQNEVSSQNINFAIPSDVISQVVNTHQSVLANNSADYYTAQGDLADSTNNYDLAILDYQKAISVDSTNANAYMGLGGEYYNKGNYTLEVLNYKKAVELDPNNASNIWLLGTAYEDLGQFNEAITYDEKAIQLDSTNKDSMYSLGILYSITGQKNKLIALIPQLSKLDLGLGEELKLLSQNLK